MIETQRTTFSDQHVGTAGARVKGAGNENFPVASKLLPAWSRPHVFAFYRFARAADDVADAPCASILGGISPQDKLDHFQAMNVQLQSGAAEPYPQVIALSRSLADTHVSSCHAENLLKAFMWDVEHPRTRNWAALMTYCAVSAAPVGRYLIDLLGGIRSDDYAPSDALCAALQVLNHLQDIKDDFVNMDRVYLPGDWLAEEGVVDADLRAATCSPGLRRVLDRTLDGVDILLAAAQPLPGAIVSKPLACEAGGILAIAEGLAKALRTSDPLAGRVELSRLSMGLRFMWGAFRAVFWG